jgi:hypothetical protein
MFEVFTELRRKWSMSKESTTIHYRNDISEGLTIISAPKSMLHVKADKYYGYGKLKYKCN